jgi:hypothetical protein
MEVYLVMTWNTFHIVGKTLEDARQFFVDRPYMDEEKFTLKPLDVLQKEFDAHEHEDCVHVYHGSSDFRIYKPKGGNCLPFNFTLCQ